MTWEISFLLSVLMVCGTFLYSKREKEPVGLSDEVRAEFQEIRKHIADARFFAISLSEEFMAHQKQLEGFKADHESVHKLAEETKKMVSNQNLAMGFTPRVKR